MGAPGSYDRDVNEGGSTREEIFVRSRETYTGADIQSARQPERQVCDPILEPKNAKRECCENPKLIPITRPIVPAIDVTRSRGEDAVIIYQKLPKLLFELLNQTYLGAAKPVISFCAVGDASSGDQAPLQVGQFEADMRLDDVLSKIWLEEGGGGTGQESYELAAYFYAKKSILDCLKRGDKGIFFFIGDEAPYPEVKTDQVKAIIGDNLKQNIPTEQIFAELQEKYRVFFIYQQKSAEQLKKDVDAEIKKRVKQAGGMYEGVDIRASLLWNNRNDLDLHVITPSGYHIYFGAKQAPCGGYLDVDMNVGGETTKPVENVRWAKGKARPGNYRVFVQNFRFHESSQSATEFHLELEVNGEIKHFSGKTKTGLSGPESDVEVCSFDYEKVSEQSKTKKDVYAAYAEEAILAQWRKYLPTENILSLAEPKGVVDLMLGAIALTEPGSKINLPKYIQQMRDRDQTDHRCKMVEAALKNLAASVKTATVSAAELPTAANKKKGRSRRI